MLVTLLLCWNCEISALIESLLLQNAFVQKYIIHLPDNTGGDWGVIWNYLCSPQTRSTPPCCPSLFSFCWLLQEVSWITDLCLGCNLINPLFVVCSTEPGREDPSVKLLLSREVAQKHIGVNFLICSNMNIHCRLFYIKLQRWEVVWGVCYSDCDVLSPLNSWKKDYSFSCIFLKCIS